jgi:hypothetical protein
MKNMGPSRSQQIIQIQVDRGYITALTAFGDIYMKGYTDITDSGWEKIDTDLSDIT